MSINFPKAEEEILKYWKDKKIFEKSVSNRPEDKPYVFYDGPPFATGLPHYGHILSSVIKDVIPRYWAMKGYRVRRRWGWDCHGLPIENIVEKELNVSGKKEIEGKVGIEKFNEICHSKVLTYTREWKKMIDRIGRWVEFDNAYKTMDPTYMESVWWAVKSIWNKGLIYEGRKVLMFCPRCETPVSKAEVAMDNSYKDITEESLTAKFKIKDPEKHNLPKDTFILAWTTTPWTLPGNVALAINKDIDYVLVKSGSQHFILAKDRLSHVFKDKKYEINKEIKGSKLIGIKYDPLFKIPAVLDSNKDAWYVANADFVTTEEGTGIVHTAVIYGEDDYELGAKINLPMIPLLDNQGVFNQDAPELIRGQYFKKAEKNIKDDLEKRGLIFSRENYTHSYPFCWRCDTQLFYNAISAWFIDIQKTKTRLIELNEKINWHPAYLKHGRFLNILKTAPDWNISRNRYWATPLPFWKCDNKGCGNVICVGSFKELKEKSINFDDIYDTDDIEKVDIHKHHVDKIKLRCNKCGSEMTRIPEVIDCWVESSSMPFAEFHYPFENEKIFKRRFPGQFIAEYIAQTRAWFYYMHAMAVLLFDNISFENCVTTGTILNEKGEKLSKSKMNYTDPWEIINQYGVDALRYYLMTSVVMQADNLFFNDRDVRDIYNKVINILWNVVSFYKMYNRDYDRRIKAIESNNVLDKWILSKLRLLIKEVTEEMDNYNTVKAGRPMKEFIDDLSTWYLRRSRERFKGEDKKDKKFALATLHDVLITLSKIMAPFTPFITEKVYQELEGGKESVHLEDWPETEERLIDNEVLEEMDLARKIVEAGLAARAEAGVKVRQPLQSYATSLAKTLSDELINIIKDELNIKELKFGKEKLNTKITKKLEEEGLLRELVRRVNAIRKKKGLTIEDKIKIYYNTGSNKLKSVFENFSKDLKKDTLSEYLAEEPKDDSESVELNGQKIDLYIEKII